MSRVERHAAEQAAKKGKRGRKQAEAQQQDRPVEKVDYAIEDMLQADANAAINNTAGSDTGFSVDFAADNQANAGTTAEEPRRGRVARAEEGRAARNAKANKKDVKKAEKAAGKAQKQEKKKRKGRVTPFGRFISFIGTVIMLAGILACLTLAAPRLAGLQSFIVVSGSMEPEIPIGSMIYSKEVDPTTIKKDDIIVFYSGNIDSDAQEDAQAATADSRIPITHRVVENDTEKGQIVTKGDANQQNDRNPVQYDNIIGLVVKHIPKLGFAASPIGTPIGKAALAMVIIAGWLLAEVGSHIRKTI